MACLVDESSLVRPPGRFALHDAVEKADNVTVAELLATFERQGLMTGGADDARQISLEEKDPLGATPLHTAILFSNVDALRRLIISGAKLDVKCSGAPPLHVAIAMASIPASASSALLSVRMLLAAGVDAAALDDAGRTWVHAAAEAGVVEVAAALRADARAAAVPLDAPDRSGMTPLGLAAAFRHGEMLRWLLEQGADPAAPCSPQGDTPAHVASARGWADGLDALRAAASGRGGGTAALDASRNYAGLTPGESFAPHAADAGALILTHAACAAHQTSESTARRCGARGWGRMRGAAAIAHWVPPPWRAAPRTCRPRTACASTYSSLRCTGRCAAARWPTSSCARARPKRKCVG